MCSAPGGGGGGGGAPVVEGPWRGNGSGSVSGSGSGAPWSGNGTGGGGLVSGGPMNGSGSVASVPAPAPVDPVDDIFEAAPPGGDAGPLDYATRLRFANPAAQRKWDSVFYPTGNAASVRTVY